MQTAQSPTTILYGSDGTMMVLTSSKFAYTTHKTKHERKKEEK